MIFNSKEQEFLRYRAERFEGGKHLLTRNAICKQQRLSESELGVLVLSMKSIGALEEITTSRGLARSLRATYTAVELAREIDATHATQEPPDFVEQIQKRIKQSPIAATAILAFLLLAFVAPIYSMVVDVMERLGWIGIAS